VLQRIVVGLVTGAVVIGGIVIPAPAGPRVPAPRSLEGEATAASPVATSEEEYLLYGRVFPDPHGCNQGQPGYSPFAKGNVCAVDFLQFAELQNGLAFLQELEGFDNFIETYTLHEDFACSGKPVGNPDNACKNFRSAGLPVTASADGSTVTRDRAPLIMVRVTDESVPNKDKEYFVFPLSIHGIERAGVEGGTRAVEDLVTWAACEQAPNLDVCPNEGDIPHPLLEATPNKSVTAGDALKRSVVYFIYPNPDGWLRGERTTGTQFFQRYNGNGVDLNRDWPEQGYTFRPYTPWSEPETRSFGRVLQAIGPTDPAGNPKWTGGIDLHGQLVDRAFSFTLIGGSERPYDKNQRVLQTVKGAWSDAEQRLAWSPLIKPNDAPQQPDDPRVYGVQWGTIWDTIAYTVTGALGNWIDSPIGLNADGIDNEMSLSHLSNCGIGSCFDPDVEQLHVDGNKSLVYSMINYSLKPEGTSFRTKGRVGYVHNRGFVSEKTNRLEAPPKFTKLPQQDDIDGACPADPCLRPDNEYTFEFDVNGPKQDVYNGGINITLTCANAQGVGPCAASEARLERRKAEEDLVQGEEWELVASYFNQSPLYVQAGQALEANLPVPGRYRVRIEGNETAGIFNFGINFTEEKAWPDPGQIGYRATNMRFWQDLKPFARPGLGKLTPRQIATTNAWKRRYDTIVITDKVYKNLGTKLRRWVARHDGNLVLTDSALRMLPAMGMVKGGIDVQKYYLGYVNFATAGREATYGDPLAKKINQPGAAEGMSGDEIHRRQTYESVPIGYAIQNAQGGDASNSPVWAVKQSVWKKARGKQRATGTTGDTTRVSYGEIRYHGGRIRIIGALLPMPTDKFDNPFGVGDYGVTYAGYQMLKNLLNWNR
jgi:Zinc carboxypeptidase